MSSSELALGLMSGTSADGVSAALGEFKDKHFKLLGFATHSYPNEIFNQVRRGGDLPARELSALNMEIGEQFALTANRLLKKLGVDPKKVTCIGSHGQTIYHGPRDRSPNTLQIGDPAVIAHRTGLPVVSNFRPGDIAAGGEGAPLIPFFDQYFYEDGPVRAFQNIGGIANVTVAGKGVKVPLAFDTGPGNCLMDMAIREITGGKESFDHNGQRAKHGKIEMALVHRLMQNEFFKRPPPKSTGLELFSRSYLDEHFGSLVKERPDDALASLNYLTCLSIQESYRSFIFGKFPLKEVIVSGGGAHNKTLMKKLECLFAPIPVKSIEELGIPTQAKEPLAFAFFGLRAFHGKVNHLPSVTGAKKAVVLGSVTRA